MGELQYVSVNGTIVSGGQMVPPHHSFAHLPPLLRELLPSPICTDAMGMGKAGEGKGREAKLSFPSLSPHVDIAVRDGQVKAVPATELHPNSILQTSQAIQTPMQIL